MIVFYLTRRLQSQERMKAIEKGVSIPFEPVDLKGRAARARTAGIVLVALGLGMIVLFGVITAVHRDRDTLVGIGVAAIPIMVGLGLLYDFRLRIRDIEADAPRREP
jgi:hypothetical protein